MKIYYNKTTKLFAGAGNISSECKESEVDCIEIEESEWMSFLNSNNGKTIKMVDEKLTSEEIVLSLETLKLQRISVRKLYLKSVDWYWIRKLRENIEVSQEIIDKSNLARQEINEIENTIEENITNYSLNF